MISEFWGHQHQQQSTNYKYVLIHLISFLKLYFREDHLKFWILLDNIIELISEVCIYISTNTYMSFISDSPSEHSRFWQSFQHSAWQLTLLIYIFWSKVRLSNSDDVWTIFVSSLFLIVGNIMNWEALVFN